MKRNVKAILATTAVSVLSLFGAGCSAGDKISNWVDQLFCEHATTEIVAAVAPTCTEDGYTEYEKCTKCGKEVTKGAKIEALGHTIVVEEGYEATCTTLGKTDKKTCSVCEEVIQEAKYIPVLGHEKKDVKAVKATCTTPGMTAGVVCEHEGCNYVFEGCEVIPVTGHTVGADGITCKDCGAVDLENFNPANYTVKSISCNGTDSFIGDVIAIDLSEFEQCSGTSGICFGDLAILIDVLSTPPSASDFFIGRLGDDGYVDCTCNLDPFKYYLTDDRIYIYIEAGEYTLDFSDGVREYTIDESFVYIDGQVAYNAEITVYDLSTYNPTATASVLPTNGG